MDHKIEIDGIETIEELKNALAAGGKFVVYSYCISVFFAVTLRRLSPAIFIPAGTTSKAKSKYNRISYFLGWWCIPWGPMYTIQNIKDNNKGGLDVTADIMKNIDQAGLDNKIVRLEELSMLFDKPEKGDDKAFRKVFTQKLAYNPALKSVVVGMYLNTGNTEPIYTVGIESSDDYSHHIPEIKKALYTQFLKRAPFEFIDLNSEDDLGATLKEQGVFYLPSL